MPDDEQAYVFPATDAAVGRVHDWDEICKDGRELIDKALNRALRAIGAHDLGYNFTSLRREHARRSREALGETLAIYRAGYRSDQGFRRLLRAEPDWKNLPRSLLDKTLDDQESKLR
jgi:hypothetical protein